MPENPAPLTAESVPWIVQSALRAVIGNDFVIDSCTRLPSRRNEVLHVTGSLQSDRTSRSLVAKWFRQPGIANEATVLRDAFDRQVHVPRIIGTTAEVLLMEFIEGPNLCDVLTETPSPRYGRLLAKWLAQYHTAFQRSGELVLTKGDARIRNFICANANLVGVDFEESCIGSYLDDLGCACASILDTDPIFTRPKLRVCKALLSAYAISRLAASPAFLVRRISPHIVSNLRATLQRRGNPDELAKAIGRFESGEIGF
jgi:tRNA A-37 threonylcarbamoyl transferase component Bud32